jgi:hypothetical protein
VVALTREDAHRRGEDDRPLVLRSTPATRHARRSLRRGPGAAAADRA